MRNKFITLLLLSHGLLAPTSAEVLPPLAQNEVRAAVVNQHALDMRVHGLAGELFADEVQIAPGLSASSNLISSKAYEDLISIMPQLGLALNKSQPRQELDGEILKFASMPRMRSSIVLIYDENGKKPLHSKNADVVAPIASITKLMTAMIVLDAKLPLDEEISISTEDISRKKNSRSRTRSGMTMTRGELLKLALMSSDNLSAAALARTFPGGTEAALAQMNAKARELGMNSSRFMDPTGLHSGNVSTANDLVKMVRAAQGYELINQFSTATSHTIEVAGRKPLRFHNTNPLVRNASWDIGISKTGYISEAGRCLVMEAKISERPVIIVLLDSWGKHSRIGDANRVKQWMENASLRGRSSQNM